MMNSRLEITYVSDGNNTHYKIYDKLTGKTICCNKSDFNKIIWNLLGV